MNIDKFYVRVVRDGDKHGRDDCLTHRGQPLVEFYDTRYDHAAWKGRGQFVQSYYVETLLDRSTGGLCLMGGVPEWSLSGEDMKIVREFLTNEVKK